MFINSMAFGLAITYVNNTTNPTLKIPNKTPT